MKSPNVAASASQRLVRLAQSKGWEFNRVLARYGVERVICRLDASPRAPSISLSETRHRHDFCHTILSTDTFHDTIAPECLAVCLNDSRQSPTSW